MAYNVRDSIWFGNVGIVHVHNEFGQDKFYIGAGVGLDQKSDEQHIAAWGQKIDPEYLIEWFENRMFIDGES